MFTGIVEERGWVARLEETGEGVRLTVGCRDVLSDATLGSSIAVNGCCLTVAGFVEDHGVRAGFHADLMVETLRATDLGELSIGSPVNLERPLRLGGRLGGHLVQGHVDGVGTVTGREERAGTVFVTIGAPPAVAPYVVPKGSIAVQGVSLTVVDVDRADGPTFRVGLIPHTRSVTTLGGLGPGDRVNLEVDVIAKYVQGLLEASRSTADQRPEGSHRVP